MGNINALIKQCSLGTIEGQILPVSGGLMHKMFKVQTKTGTYAIKCLNPEIMSRPDATKNYSEAERLERILEDNRIPIVAAITFDDKKMVSVNGKYYYIFPWQEGSITDFNEITAEQCFIAGEILGKIHCIDAKNESQEEPVLSHVDFEAYLEKAKAKDSSIASLLEANMPLLKKAQNKLNEARKKLPSMRAISNDDMDPKNVMWNDGNPYVIDLECLGYSNPISSCLNLALQWAGTVNDNFSKDNLEAFFKGYLSAYDNGFRLYDELFGIAYTWIDWLEYNIKRALGMVSLDTDEIKLGEAETESTINRIKYLSSIETDICQVLKNLPAPNTRVFFVRHAEPNYDNHDDRLRELSPKGLEDRKLVTAFLSDKDIDVALSSPFKRAIDTVADFAEKNSLPIETIEDFRERKVDSCWIEDFTAFSQNQWSDFDYKLSDGECLREVQDRNIAALNELLEKYSGKNIVIGSHGTALSTIINYFDSSFGYEDFEKIRFVMPWIVEFVFDADKKCIAINKYNLK